MDPRRRPIALQHALLVGAGLAAGLAIRAANLGGPAFGYDELYHVFAAKGLLDGEGLALPSGRPYTRGALVSLLTAGAFVLFGEHEWSARVPALLFGAASLVLIYAAGRTLFGPIAGVTALWLLALSPEAVDADRYARMYSPLTAFGLLAALAAYRALEGGGRRWAVVAVAAAAVAVHLHPAALMLVVAVGAYAASCCLAAALRGERQPRRHLALALGLLALAAASALTPPVRSLVREAAATPLPWYRPEPGDVLTYHRHLAATYGWLWPLLWPATFVALLTRPRPGLFTALAFWLQLVILSVAVATKHVRYIIHVLPFAWLVLGGAAQSLWPPARDALQARVRAWVPGRLAGAAASAAVLVLAVAPLARLMPSVPAAASRPWRTEGAFATGHFDDWRGLERELRPRLDPRALLVTRVQLAARYYLGRPAHHLLSAHARRGGGDWEQPSRTDDDQVQHAGDLARLRRLGAPVWLVVEAWRWEQPGYLDEGLVAAAARDCRPVPVGAVAFVVFACDPITAVGLAPAADRSAGERGGTRPERGR
ncbi:MAG TPA: glycosyltransferase family 39 protein [Thermodesulfobacteriota bacterium]